MWSPSPAIAALIRPQRLRAHLVERTLALHLVGQQAREDAHETHVTGVDLRVRFATDAAQHSVDLPSREDDRHSRVGADADVLRQRQVARSLVGKSVRDHVGQFACDNARTVRRERGALGAGRNVESSRVPADIFEGVHFAGEARKPGDVEPEMHTRERENASTTPSPSADTVPAPTSGAIIRAAASAWSASVAGSGSDHQFEPSQQMSRLPARHRPATRRPHPKRAPVTPGRPAVDDWRTEGFHA